MTEVRRTAGLMQPWVIAAPFLIALELLVIQAAYVVKVIRWRPPELADLRVTAGRIQETERLCHSVGYPAQSSVCQHEVVLADGAGSFLFPRYAVEASDRLLNANEDRLTTGAHVELWHQPDKPDRIGESLGAIWQIRGDGWIIPYGTARTIDKSVEMQGVVCSALMSAVAAAACLREVWRRRTGRRRRVRMGRESGLVAALGIATYVAVTMEDPSLGWPVFGLLAFLIILSLYEGDSGEPQTRPTPTG